MVNYEGLSYGAWSLVGDPTIRPRKERAEVADLQYVDLHPVEIRSRILSRREPLLTRPSVRDLSHTHSITYQEEITAVLTALDKAFNQWSELDQNTPIPSYIYSNESCGLHVHIGNGRKGFPYRTVRNIVSTYVANERQIDTMHSTNRIGGGKHPLMIQHNRFGCQYWDTSVITPAAYNMPWATHHHMSVYNRRGRAARDSPMLTHDFQESRYPAEYLDDPEIRRAAFEYSCAAQLTLINRAPNLEALRHMQGSWSHNSTVNLENLPTREELSEGRKRKLTIEFRQHAGTLSVTEVLAWINVVSNVVVFSHTVSDRDIVMLCAGQWSSPFHTTDSFLGTIGCAPKTIKHYRGRAGLRPGCPSYAQRRFDRITNQPVMSFHPYEPTTALVRFLAHEHLRLNAPDEVQHRIGKKFASGGYGQFPDWYLDQVKGIIDLTDFPDAREQLRIGWIDPRTQASHKPRPSPSAQSLPRRPLRIVNGVPSTSSSSDDEKLAQDTGDTKISDTSADMQLIKLAEGEIGATFVRRARHEDTASIQPGADQSAVHADRLGMVREEEQADESNGNRELRAVLADHDIHVPDGGRVQPFRGWRLLGAGGNRGFSETHGSTAVPAPLALSMRALRKSTARLVTPVIIVREEGEEV
ncbi:putative amidoligase enzyme [Teratosphaeria destructans]|uniref:Amidoligase enzyme n=1 Tax=Teratosphaeria destructans TaxID=418781 RepID=A0A9W7W3W1_9PEZI|nr:putative amidoligase enzyme [Teratosphaeria destructans]